jgi:hypothetical protein
MATTRPPLLPPACRSGGGLALLRQPEKSRPEAEQRRCPLPSSCRRAVAVGASPALMARNRVPLPSRGAEAANLGVSSIVAELPPSSACYWCHALVLLEAAKPLSVESSAEVEEQELLHRRWWKSSSPLPTASQTSICAWRWRAVVNWSSVRAKVVSPPRAHPWRSLLLEH